MATKNSAAPSAAPADLPAEIPAAVEAPADVAEKAKEDLRNGLYVLEVANSSHDEDGVAMRKGTLKCGPFKAEYSMEEDRFIASGEDTARGEMVQHTSAALRQMLQNPQG